MSPASTFLGDYGTVPSADSIRGWLRDGFNTLSIARLCGCSEAAVWNALARDAAPRLKAVRA